MKKLITIMTLLMSTQVVLALGDTTPLPSTTDAMTDTVNTLNQVSGEGDGNRNIEQQDQAEREFQENRIRQNEEWAQQQEIDNNRFDVPEN